MYSLHLRMLLMLRKSRKAGIELLPVLLIIYLFRASSDEAIRVSYQMRWTACERRILLIIINNLILKWFAKRKIKHA